MRTSRTIENSLHHPVIRGTNGIWAKAPLRLLVRNIWKLALVVSCLLESSAVAQSFAYVTNASSSSVSVINTATNTVTATVGVGGRPIGVALRRMDLVLTWRTPVPTQSR